MNAPFPYFGGKASIAPLVWQLLGDVKHYIEPFAGGAAVLLARADYRQGEHIETINDLDGMIANVWRALRFAPDEVAKWCDWPVSHIDLQARKNKLNKSYRELCEKLIADDEYFDAKLAGYYIWAASCWIGSGLLGDSKKHQRPHLGDAGMGVHKLGKIPHLGDAGRGVHKLGKRPQSNAPAAITAPFNVNIYSSFRALSERLRYVRTICGDWRRVCGGDWQDGPGSPVGIFFDPPYSDKANRNKTLYTEESDSVAHDVRAWCIERGQRENYRIVLAGYYEEHEELLQHGWTAHRYKVTGGYSRLGNQSSANRFRETLFISPHCELEKKQERLF
jgi:DNA adenine methylase